MPHGVVRALLALVCLLAVGCSAGADRPAAEATRPPEREYWPTDDWRTADPVDHGFDAEEVATIEGLVEDLYTSVRSILIVRNGYLVYERYWQGVDASDGHDIRSVTKSVISALVGIALADGAIESLDQTVGELLADHLPAEADPRMGRVTVRHLLGMTSGLPGDQTPSGEDPLIFERIDRSPDRVRASLQVPLTAEPGSRWAYSNVSSDLLAVIVAETTGRSAMDFARERLFGPIGTSLDGAFEPVVVGWPPTPEQIEQYRTSRVAWPRDAQGYHWGSGGLRLPARDLARFGYLYLNGGAWDGEQIVPADYVRDSTAPGRTETGANDDYGWQWWVSTGGDHASFLARGYGGQVIEVVPDLDLVAVVTSDPERRGGDTHNLVEHAIAPAADD
jgi:CubicO group peptidase (beta-lactamase class C family)